MNVAAAAFDRGSQTIPFVVDVKLYWATCRTLQEADYLSAILNSETVNAAIKPFQSMGLLGERDIHKKLLELPIPLFSPKDPDHNALAILGETCRRKAEHVVGSTHYPISSSIARQRAFVREELTDEMRTINRLVHALIQNENSRTR
jgi:hypothetical protein